MQQGVIIHPARVLYLIFHHIANLFSRPNRYFEGIFIDWAHNHAYLKVWVKGSANGKLWGKFALKSEVKFSPAARTKFGFRRAKLTAYAVSEIAASGSSDRVPQPCGLPFFFTTAGTAVISLSTQWIISLMATAMNFAARQGNFACGLARTYFPTTSHLLRSSLGHI